MTSLKFLGNGSAFNYDLDNTAAYFKYDNTFYIFDCGEKIASKIVKYINFISLLLCENLKWEQKPKL